jgi:hypothetical protein
MNEVFKVDEILKTETFSEFYSDAYKFCEFIETYKNENTIEFLIAVRNNLLKLYQSAINLQWVELRSNEEYNDKLDTKDFENVVSFISKNLNEKRYYWHVFDPTNEDNREAVCGDLLDDLSDIYKDIKYSILIFNLEKPDCKEIALWEFKFDFDKHWNDHCINAMNAIHYFLQNEE